MAKENECCRFCGKLREDAKKFYKTVSKEPWCDEIYFCDECRKILENANWFKDRKVEEA